MRLQRNNIVIETEHSDQTRCFNISTIFCGRKLKKKFLKGRLSLRVLREDPQIPITIPKTQKRP
jgi:hypothetical protein